MCRKSWYIVVKLHTRHIIANTIIYYTWKISAMICDETAGIFTSFSGNVKKKSLIQVQHIVLVGVAHLGEECPFKIVIFTHLPRLLDMVQRRNKLVTKCFIPLHPFKNIENLHENKITIWTLPFPWTPVCYYLIRIVNSWSMSIVQSVIYNWKKWKVPVNHSCISDHTII